VIIDVHGHIGRLAEREFSLTEMTQYLDSCAIGRALISNLDAASVPLGASNLEETPANVACLRMCREDGRLVPLYWVRLGQIDSHVRAFAGALEIEPFVGAAFSPALNGFAADDTRLDSYLSVLAKRKRVALFHTSRDELARPAAVYTLAKRHPRVPVVLCDAGGDIHWGEAIDVVSRAWQREDARLYLCCGRATADELLAAVKALGAQRVVYGSEAPRLGPRHAEHYQALLDRLQESLVPEQFAQVTGRNAAELFRLAEI
jgi:predicted TIM-barrel fold metal-dependent hydrolase